MAKRKKGTKRTTRRRSRIGSTKSDLMDIVYVAGGMAAGVVVSNLVKKALPDDMKDSTRNLVLAAVPVAGGFFLPKFIKSDVGKKLGLGMAGFGGLKALQALKVFDGLGAIAADTNYRVPKLLAAAMNDREIRNAGNNSNYNVPLTMAAAMS